MAKLKIVKMGDPVLRKVCRPVEKITLRTKMLLDDMLETMRKARGVGLAAQQIGRTERMCVIEIPEGCEDDEDGLFNAPVAMPLKLFNPVIIAKEGSQRDKEGCLSFPGVGGSVTRAEQVTCQYLDE